MEVIVKTNRYHIPKSFIYTGDYQTVEMEITHYHYDADGFEITKDFKPIEGKKHYIQVVGLADVEKLAQVTKYFEVNSLVIEDIFNVRQRNKIEIIEKGLFLVIHIEYIENNVIQEGYMSLLVFEDTIISFHEIKPNFLDEIHALIKENIDLKSRSTDYLLFLILDIITDHHIDTYEWIEKMQIQFEDQILDEKNIDQDSFYIIRKQLLKLKNTVTPTLEQLEKTIERNSLFQIENKIYFDDLLDHLKRLDNHINQARELMRNILDLHINNQSNKMNRIMTTLTLFSAIFIPLSFLTGFFRNEFCSF
jgi:magnesium transporter